MRCLLVKANDATAAHRRVFFDLRAGDGITPVTTEANGQPQLSSTGGAWTSTGIGLLTSIGNGRYYADLTQTVVATAGTLIETRYKSTNTAECPGDSVQVVAFDPNAVADLGVTGIASASTNSTAAVTSIKAVLEALAILGDAGTGVVQTGSIPDTGTINLTGLPTTATYVAGQTILIPIVSGGVTPVNLGDARIATTAANIGSGAWQFNFGRGWGSIPVVGETHVVVTTRSDPLTAQLATLPNGAIDLPTFAANALAALGSAYLVTTGTTSPVTADSQWYVAGYNANVRYYKAKTLGLYAWTDGTAWYLTSTTPGASLPAGYYKTANGASVTGPYFAQGTATGTPAVVAHGNAVLSGFQPDQAGLANLDVPVSSRLATSGYAVPPTANDNAAAVWTSATRTLSSFGTLTTDVAAAVWSATTRTLTGLGSLLTQIINAARGGAR